LHLANRKNNNDYNFGKCDHNSSVLKVNILFWIAIVFSIYRF